MSTARGMEGIYEERDAETKATSLQTSLCSCGSMLCISAGFLDPCAHVLRDKCNMSNDG